MQNDSDSETLVRKGRSDDLIMKRNECLIARYYYYGTIRGKTYEDTLNLLVREFFLSQSTILRQINTNGETVMMFKKSAHGPRWFQARWPHLKW